MARTLAISELFKYNWRVDVFLNKYKRQDFFQLLNNGKVINFEFSQEIYDNVKNRNFDKLKGSILQGIDGNQYRLSDLEKTGEFGGKGFGFGIQIELREIEKMNDEISKEKIIPLKIGNKIAYVKEVCKTKGTPKSDFYFLDQNDSDVFHISHKHGSKPKHFQQWSGITEKTIYQINEVRDFVETVKTKYPKQIPNTITVAREITDSDLKMKSIYGTDYGSLQFGLHNVDAVIQGSMSLENTGNYYTIAANHVHVNGTPMNDSYEPILICSYKGDRHQEGIWGARFSISPKDSRKVTEYV